MVLKVQKESNEINGMMQDLKLKTGILATLTGGQLYYDTLAVFADTFNDATWIDHLSIQRENEKDIDTLNLVVDGFSRTHNSLGVFLESLSGNQRVKDVVLAYAKKKDQAPDDPEFSSMIQFKLTCSIIKGSLK